MRSALIKRMIPAALCFASVYTVMNRTYPLNAQQAAYWLGSRLGASREPGADKIDRSFYMVSGPFLPTGPYSRAWNWVYRHSYVTLDIGLAFIAAAGVYAVCGGPRRRPRLFSGPGPTMCGGCGYQLAGLKEPRCPECGLVI